MRKFKELTINDPVPILYIRPNKSLSDASLVPIQATGTPSTLYSTVYRVKGREYIPRDLTPVEIGSIAKSLIRGDTIVFLLNNY